MGGESRSPLHSDSGASPYSCPSPFLPLGRVDISLPVLLRLHLGLDERDGHHALRGYAVDQRVGVGVGTGTGADAVENVHLLLH